MSIVTVTHNGTNIVDIDSATSSQSKTLLTSGKYLNSDIGVNFNTDANLVASNIKKGVSIYNVVGTFEGWVPTGLEIYRYGAWGDTYSASQIARCDNGWSWSSDYNSFISFDTALFTVGGNGLKASNAGNLHLYGIDKQFNFDALNTITIEFERPTTNYGDAWVVAASNWNQSASVYQGNYMTIYSSDISILGSAYQQGSGLATINISSIHQSGYIYFGAMCTSSSGTYSTRIRRIYLT